MLYAPARLTIDLIFTSFFIGQQITKETLQTSDWLSFAYHLHNLITHYNSIVRVLYTSHYLRIINFFNILNLSNSEFSVCVCVIYKFVGCNASYIKETTGHFSTHIHEHMFSDRTSPIFKHTKFAAVPHFMLQWMFQYP